MKTSARPVLFLISAVLFTACDSYDNDPVCTAEARPGITITVLMDGGGSPDDGELEAVAREGAFEDTQPVVGGGANLAYERAGTYMVEVVDSGNDAVLWTQSGVVVTEGECHVATMQLTAIVEPS